MGVAWAADKPIEVIALDRKEPVQYEKDIEPILRAKCTVCHSGKELKGKFDAGSYAGVMKGGSKGPVVVPGKSGESPLVHYVGKTQKPFMPPKDEEPLTPQELALIKLWIDQGAKPPTTVLAKPIVTLSAIPSAFAPARAIVLTAQGAEVIVGRGNQIHVYETASGKHLRQFTDPNLKEPPAAHRSLVESLALSADGKWLASGSFQEVVIWDFATGAIAHRITGFAHNVVALAFSPQGTRLACGGGAPTEDGELKLVDAANGAVLLDIKNAHSDTVYGLAFSPDGNLIASASADKFVKVHQALDGKWVKSFEGHTHHVLDVSWRHDGKLLASAGADNVIKVWDFESGEQRRTIVGHGKYVSRVVFVAKTTLIVTTSGDRTARTWNSENGGAVWQYNAASDSLDAVAVSSDGKWVVVGGTEGLARVLDGKTGKLLHELKPTDNSPMPPKP